MIWAFNLMVGTRNTFSCESALESWPLMLGILVSREDASLTPLARPNPYFLLPIKSSTGWRIYVVCLIWQGLDLDYGSWVTSRYISLTTSKQCIPPPPNPLFTASLVSTSWGIYLIGGWGGAVGAGWMNQKIIGLESGGWTRENFKYSEGMFVRQEKSAIDMKIILIFYAVTISLQKRRKMNCFPLIERTLISYVRDRNVGSFSPMEKEIH